MDAQDVGDLDKGAKLDRTTAPLERLDARARDPGQVGQGLLGEPHCDPSLCEHPPYACYFRHSRIESWSGAPWTRHFTSYA